MIDDEYLKAPLKHRLIWPNACGSSGICSDRRLALNEIERLERRVRELEIASYTDDLLNEAEDFDWQCENGVYLAKKLIAEIRKLRSRLEKRND